MMFCVLGCGRHPLLSSTLVSDVLSFLLLVTNISFFFSFVLLLPQQSPLLERDSENLLLGSVSQLKIKSFHWVELTC